jgi:hypothetical protein
MPTPHRDALVNQISVLGATDAAIEWAGQNLGAKNTLTAEDASIVEAAFRDRMHVLEPEAYQPNSSSGRPIPPAGTAPPPCSPSSVIPLADADTRVLGRESQRPKKRAGSRMRIEGADNSTLVKPRRSRDKDHLRFFAVQPCTVGGPQPCEAHHLRFAQPRAQMVLAKNLTSSRTFGQRIAQWRLILYRQDIKFDNGPLRALRPDANKIKGFNSKSCLRSAAAFSAAIMNGCAPTPDNDILPPTLNLEVQLFRLRRYL